MMKLLIATLSFFIATGHAVANPVDERDPRSIIKDATHHLLETLNGRREEFTAKPELLHSLVHDDLLPLMDQEYSARLILGRAGRGVTADQLEAFSQAISTVLINRYATGLMGFKSDEQMEILPLTGNNTDKMTRVRTRIRLGNGGFAPIDYAFRKTENGWKVFDVTVEGISYIITFRNQISPQVQSEGIDKVTEEIRLGNLRINE